MFTNNLNDMLNSFTLSPISTLSAGQEYIGTFQQAESTKEGYKTKFKVPGYEKSEIKVSLSNRHGCGLDLFGNKIKTILVEAQNKEYGLSKFYTTVSLATDDSSVRAELKNGILTVTVDFDEKKSKVKLIEVV